MARSRSKHKGRATSGGFLALPHAVMDSPAFRGLSAHALKLLIDLAAQYRGANNGDLSAAWAVMRERGWKSRDTLAKALRELLEAGLIERTREGGRPGKGGNRVCALYALTWLAIDDCNGKCTPTRTPSGLWREKTPTRPACHSSTPTVSIGTKTADFQA